MTDPLREILQTALGQAFRVERELGGGGMSRVFVARDVALDRDVVVKVLARESTAGVSGERFRREIQVIARLQHPHIVPILSAGVADGALYYVMPFIGGETLRARLAREGPMTVADAARVLREVLDALAFAHRHGVIHRDVKPENVLIEAGHAIVADFGIAKALRESGTMTAAGVAMGTPAYMSPEQATADPTADHRADLYAVGVVAYELFTGAPPFSGSAQQVITAHLTTPPAPLRDRRSDVPDALANLIERSLAKDPADRPQSAGEMLATLDAAITPSATTPATAAIRAAPVASSRSWRTPVITAAVVAFVAGGGSVLWRARPSAPVVAEGADLIAVMPLGAVSDTSLSRLGQDLVVTLSTNLDGVGSLRTIDAVSLLMRARKLPSPLPLADAQRLAGEFGARSVLTGTLLHEGNSVRASVTLHPVIGTDVLARATALAPAGEIASLTDSLTWELLRQVWRRGAPPSPVLTGLTTASMDALRSFLDGERAFQRLDVDPSLASYRRAFELDTTFVQAYLRYDYVNAWNLRPVDAAVRRRLMAMVDRLPERERLWLETRQAVLPVPEKIARWKAAIQRFPDYPPILMSGADLIIHSGPLYGIPLADARPLLLRLDQLVPDHADTKFHLAAVAGIIGTPREQLETAAAVTKISGIGWGGMFAWQSEILRARLEGKPLPPPESAFPFARELARLSTAGEWASLTGYLGISRDEIAYRLNVLNEVRKAGIYTGDVELSSSLGEGVSRIARGDWIGGLEALRRAEASTLLPMMARMSSARMAAIGAWTGAIDAVMADSILRRVRSLRNAELEALNRVEFTWMDGVIGVAGADESRVQRAVAALRRDSLPQSRTAARSLDGLWRYRTNENEGADSLRAVSEESMQEGESFLAIEAVDRLVVARALRKRGTPAEAERYLMWLDAAVNTPRSVTVLVGLGPLVAYERGVALDEAGQKDAAAVQFRRVIDALDMPPEAFRSVVADARARLAKIEATDAQKSRPVKQP